MAFGLTSTGLVVKTFDDARSAYEAALRAQLGASLPLGDRTLFGIWNAILADADAEIWSLLQGIYSARDRDAATGPALDTVCSLTGTFRDPARSSAVTLTLTGTPATAVAKGSRASAFSTGSKWATLTDATIASVPARANSTGYTAGDRVTTGGRVYQCITTGTSGVSSSDDPANAVDPTAADLTDGSVHWTFLGAGTAAVDVAAQSIDTGQITGTARDISVRETIISGWSGVINLADAILGADLPTDQDLRVTAEAELAGNGSTPPDALRTHLLKVTGVVSVDIFDNPTDATDGNGLPPHSVECIVRGGDDQDIADVIWENVADGIALYSGSGTVTKTVVDSEGVSQTVIFSRPTVVNIWVDITLTYDALSYPSDGDTQVKTAIVNFGNLQATGKDAVAVSIGAQAFKVVGVLDVPRSGSLGGTLIKTSASPTADTTIAISPRQLAVFVAGNITVHSSPATP